MATTKFYLDTRAVKKGHPAPLKLAITHHSQTALLNLNIQVSASQWDKKAGKVLNHPRKLFYNNYISKRKLDIDTTILKLIETGEVRTMNAKDIKYYIIGTLASEKPREDNLFASRFRLFAGKKKESTKGVYLHTLKRIQDFDKNLEQLTFEDITKDWLISFEAFLAKTAPSKNARNIHLRNIRAVFNDAIEDEITTAYPFRKFKIRPVPTPKRSLTVEQLRMLFSYPVEDYQAKYLDMFKLTFFLIGINTIDLCNLKEITPGSRIEYYRAKTGRLYSIKVEPEATELIDKYRGKKYLLDMLDRYNDYRDYRKHFNSALKSIGETKVGKRGTKTIQPLFPRLSTYWARHTWATIAAELEIPKETIAAALGHGGNTVTDIYIDFDQKKVDIANRMVLDWVLYGIR